MTPGFSVNSHTFTQGNGKDIEDISKSMELTWEQQKYLDVLKVGHAIIKVKGRIDKPVMVYFPKYEIPPSKKEERTGEVFLGSEEA